MFYTFTQNNSGGDFVFIENKVTHYVIVEAQSATVANALANDIGIYFDGCYKGLDCDCCGDRWHEVDNSDGTETPSIYGTAIEEFKSSMDWQEFKGKPTVYVHYLNREVKGFCQ